MGTQTRKTALVAFLVMLSGLSASCGSDGDPLAAYKSQPLDWQTCGQDVRDYFGQHVGMLDKLGERAKCAFFRAPLDYADPAKGDVQIALLRVRAEEPQRRMGAILLNPGGPGQDGLNVSVILGDLWTNADAADPVNSLYKELSRRYDLIGFSPRGTGFSTNLTCPSEEFFRFEAPIVVDTSQANMDDILHNSRLIADNCRKDPRMPYMNSDTTARDMDLTRHLLGDSKLNYIGFSYGTWLGTWYAGLFPERVGRMLLIGTADITAPLNSVLLNQGMGQQRVLDQVLVPYAAGHDDRFSLGATVDAVRQAYLSLRTLPGHLLAATAKLLPISKSAEADGTLLYLRAAQRMQEYVTAHPGADEAALRDWISTAQFVPDQTLNEQARTKARDIVEPYFSKLRRETKTAGLKGADALQWAVMCNDSGSALGVDAWVAENRKSAELYPFYGGYWVQNACLHWDAPNVQRPAVEKLAGAGNIVMLQSELDPWTIMEGAMKTFEALPNASMILIRDEYSHGPIPPYGRECVDRPIAEYFLYGTPPQRLTTCAGKPLPTPAR